VRGAIIGQSVRRSDGDAKVRGAAVYGIDYEEPRMLHGRLVRSPLAAARIVQVDTRRAESLPGVHAVATAADVPGVSGWLVKDQPLLARDVVRYAGEPVAAVAAETIEQADAAARAVEVELEPLEPVAHLESALAPDARLIHPEWGSYATIVEGPREGNMAWAASLTRGDVEDAFARADLVVEDEFESSRQHQLSIEPRCAVARYERGRYIIHSSTQYPFNVRDRVADILGVRASAVRVIATTVGGGFGGKLDASLEPYCALLARKTGRPVKLVNTRQEEFAGGTPRENAIVRIRSAVSRDGEILGQEATCLMDAGAYAGETPAIGSIPQLVYPSAYRVGSVRYETRVVYTNTPPTGAFRGVCGPYVVFALERHMDHVAAELGVDRRELRLRNLIRAGDTYPNGQELADAAFHEAFERLEQLAPWAQANEPRPYHGAGLAAVAWLTNPQPGSATLKLNEDGTVGVITGATEIGTGAVAAGVVQVVAEELGVRPEEVVVLPPDTDAATFDAGAQGSRTLFHAGNAVRIAAEEVRAKVFETASRMMEVAAADLELAEGAVRIVGASDRATPLADVAQEALWATGPIVGSGTYVSPPVPYDEGCMVGAMFTGFNAVTFHVHFAEVRVDPETGRVEVLRYVVVQDVGRAINPSAIEGQVQGGVAQGLGYALYERLDTANGIYVQQDLEAYRLPTALDVPPIEIVLLEHPAPHGPFGAKGVAEPPVVPVAAAVGNAVSAAIGRPVSRLPITPHDVLAALRGAPAQDAR
jgi:CO/xanthine dehydrogenase Mo-binding subunit